MTAYQFTADWFTARIPDWQRLLAPLAGTPCRCLEIGAYEGRCTFWTADNVCTHPASRLTVVDPWADAAVHARFEANLAQCPARDRIVTIRQPSWQALRALPPGTFDFVYVDGCHDAGNVLEDGVQAYRLLRPGGLLCFDDYGWSTPGQLPPRLAIDAWMQCYAGRYEVVLHQWQVWLQMK